MPCENKCKKCECEVEKSIKRLESLQNPKLDYELIIKYNKKIDVYYYECDYMKSNDRKICESLIVVAKDCESLKEAIKSIVDQIKEQGR